MMNWPSWHNKFAACGRQTRAGKRPMRLAWRPGNRRTAVCHALAQGHPRAHPPQKALRRDTRCVDGRAEQGGSWMNRDSRRRNRQDRGCGQRARWLQGFWQGRPLAGGRIAGQEQRTALAAGATRATGTSNAASNKAWQIGVNRIVSLLNKQQSINNQ